jgi:hypothetical protein
MNKHEPSFKADTDAPTRGQIYLGLEHSKHGIIAARAAMVGDAPKLEAACKRLVAAFANKRMVEVKLAAEEIEKWSGEIETEARQIKYLAAGLVKAATTHVNRRPRP